MRSKNRIIRAAKGLLRCACSGKSIGMSAGHPICKRCLEIETNQRNYVTKLQHQLLGNKMPLEATDLEKGIDNER